MKSYPARYSKAQIKIQEMAFVLVAFVVFFVIAGLFYLSLRMSGVRGDVQAQSESDAQELIRTLAETPELRWSSTASDCEGCIDMDKAILLKDDKLKIFSELWNVDRLSLEIIYPEKNGECSSVNYPECGEITLLNKSTSYKLYGSFVSLCRLDSSGSRICYLGKIYSSAKELK